MSGYVPLNSAHWREVVESFRDAPIEVVGRRLIDVYDSMPSHVVGAPALRVGGISVPRWRGERVDRLLVIKEPTPRSTAFGELFHFGRHLIEARRRCNRLTLIHHPGVRAVATRCLSVDEVLGEAEILSALSRADAYAVLGLHLGHATGEGYGIPAPIKPLLDRVPALDPTRRHVGLCWAGSGAYDFGDNRIAPLHLRPLFDAFRRSDRPVAFHSLQVGQDAGHRPPWMHAHGLDDWDDTIGLIAALDCVVTVDTAIAHLAASMGKPTHLILVGREEWRWGRELTTPWYPSAQIYRGGLASNLLRLADAIAIDTGGFGVTAVVPAISPDVLPAAPIGRFAFRSTYLSATELGSIVTLLRKVHARRVLEIGVNEGRSARVLLDALPDIERYVGIDVLPGYRFDRTDQAREVPQVPGRFALSDPRFSMVLRARGAFDVTAEELGQFDAVLIDGDHGLDAVRHDTALAEAITRPGGVIVWHDYGNPATPDVRVVLDERRRAGHDVRRITGTWLVFEPV